MIFVCFLFLKNKIVCLFVCFFVFYALKNNKWKAIPTQAIPIYGLNRSPIRLAFQHKPYKPLRCKCDGKLFNSELLLFELVGSVVAGGVLKILGYIDRANVVEQINNKITTIKDGKSNKALILNFNYSISI